VGTWFENSALLCIQIPVTFIMTILGVTVVQRYKVDIQYAYKEDETPADKESKTKNENEQLLQ